MPNEGAWLNVFQERLLVLMERDGLSKAAFARRCGLPPRTFENYFKGHKPGIDALLAISQAANVDLDWLLNAPPGPMALNRTRSAVADVLEPFFEGLVKQQAEGKPPVAGGRILGERPVVIALELTDRVAVEYMDLWRDEVVNDGFASVERLRNRFDN